MGGIITPSFKSGYAHYQGESAHSEVWEGLELAGSTRLGRQGDTLFDLTGNRGHGTLIGPTQSFDSGGLSLNYGTITDQFIVNYPAILPEVSGRSYSFFVSFTWGNDPSQTTSFFSENTGSLVYFQLLPATGAAVVGTTLIFTAIPTLDDSKLHTAGFISDENNVSIIVDGRLLETINTPGNSIVLGPKQFNLGRQIFGTSDLHEGNIDTHYFWSRAIPLSMMALLNSNPLAPFELKRRPVYRVPAAPSGFIPYPNPRYALAGGMQSMGGGIS